jgi:hypothetical protein
LSSSPPPSSLNTLLVFHIVFSFAAIKRFVYWPLFRFQQPLRPTISTRANSPLLVLTVHGNATSHISLYHPPLFFHPDISPLVSYTL